MTFGGLLRVGRRGALWAGLLTLAAALSAPRPARAYSWMVTHGYTSCATCHADPSGNGVLTAYGRAQGELLLRTQYGAAPEEAGPTAGFLWGALKTPDWLLLGGGLRAMPLAVKVGSGPTVTSLILMQADLAAEAHSGGFRAAASVGAVTSSGSAAAVAGNLIAREYWLGYGAEDGSWLLRAGRINLPYGLRIIDHTLYVRAATQTDINATQEHGISFAYSGEKLRAEVMGVLGNYQVAPDGYRQRGYSGYAEWALTGRAAIGASSLVTHAADDVLLRAATTRQAHGLFARWSPFDRLALLAEADLVLVRPSGAAAQDGVATMLQADFEAVQGLHFIATGESNSATQAGGTSYGGWVAAAWFFAPHADVRIDLMKRAEALGFDGAGATNRLGVLAYMVQGHVYF